MKGTFLPLLMIGFIALTPGTAFPAQAKPPNQQTSSKSAANPGSDHSHSADHSPPSNGGKLQKDGTSSPKQHEQRDVSGKNSPRSPATTAKVRPRLIPNDSGHSSSRNTGNLHRSGSHNSSGAVTGGLSQQSRVNSGSPIQRPNAIRPTVPLLNNARHRGANPAIVSGTANSGGRNTGAINGTGVHRKP